MLHELKNIFKQAIINQENNIKNVLVTVVDLNGSSYRKPGVRMLISSDDTSVGAVSGGCVEKEIIRRAQSVFNDNIAKIITYDGRYRLGCEGVLYILIEPLDITKHFRTLFLNAIENRESIKIDSYFITEDEAKGNYGSVITYNNQLQVAISNSFDIKQTKDKKVFSQELKPLFKLIIIGGEHDAVKLCEIAANLGWQIEVYTSIKDSKSKVDFPGSFSVKGTTPETITFSSIEENTAIVLMNHSFVQDLKYLVKLSKYKPQYIGIIGAPKRREKLFNQLFEYVPDLEEEFLDTIFTPAGLHIGATTPGEIAISIIAEILAVVRKKEPFSLKKLSKNINN
ncbi:XdhC family protein [Polaribacter sp. KT 15]|uniref:XdhC family protein n=1 Tax=Polaribacter sp. KT 15 TaxID=1896175 RepID=UPI00090BC852|nr:XdhC/CoxI family protein [Polaribacter sp. KT 15]SHM83843.1 Xanthine and CO dehydrogenase maturation factor, XdhC/CoxF family [Polaribacter sp. KT 15]